MVNPIIREGLVKVLPSSITQSIRYRRFLLNLKKFHANPQTSPFFDKEMEIIPSLIKDNSTILDIGANYGIYISFLARQFPQHEIIAFEPVASSFSILKKIVQKQKLKNVKLVNVALGNSEGAQQMILPSSITGLAYLAPQSPKTDSQDSSTTIKIDKLDSYVKKENIKKIGFIKCDVGGSELDVFRGAVEILSRDLPIVFCELEERHNERYGRKTTQTIEFMKNLGFDFFYYNDKKLMKINSIISKDLANYFFIHPSSQRDIPKNLIWPDLSHVKINKGFYSR